MAKRATPLAFLVFVLIGAAAEAQGNARLRTIAPAPPEGSCPRTPITCNSTVEGSIADTDCQLASGARADLYALMVPPASFWAEGVKELPTQVDPHWLLESKRTMVSVSMTSTALDSYVVFEQSSALEAVPEFMSGPLPVVARDDNGGGGTDAKLSLAAVGGPWVVVPQGKKRGLTGAYTLTVSCTPPQ